MVKTDKLDVLGLPKGGEIHASLNYKPAVVKTKKHKGGIQLKDRVYIGS